MDTILVTGGAGYIGSHTIVELVNAGYDPIIVDNLCNTSIQNIKGIERIIKRRIKWYNIDCTSETEMNDLFSKENTIKGTIHFAAYKSVEESVKNPQKYYTNNIDSLNILLDKMLKYDVKNIIFSSSCTVYGMPEILPVDENAEFKKAESPYAETKQICEKIINDNICNSVSLRYFNPIGNHKSSLIGDCSKDKLSNLVPIIAEVAIGKRKEMIIYGNDYNTTDGTCIRDYIHVEDLATSHVKSMDFLINNPGKYIFNVGAGIGISVLDVIRAFEKKNNIKINYCFGQRRNGDIEEIYANCNLIKNSLNWEVKKNIDDALQSAWNWELQKDK